MKIKVIFDIWLIGDSADALKTGIYRVADLLFRNLYSQKEIKLFYANDGYITGKCANENIAVYLHEKEINIERANTRKRRKFVPFRKEKLFRFLYKKINIHEYKVSYNKKVIKEAQIFHSPYYPIPQSISKFRHIKKVITIHDLIPILFPQYNVTTEMLKEIVESIADNGYAICVSENTKKDILKYEPRIDPNRVFVSLLAASPDTFYVCKNEEKLQRVKNKYNLPQKYFLGLSTIEPRKNITHTIRCFIQMITTHNIDDLSLVLVGAKGWMYDEIFEEYENTNHLKDKIIFTGRVEEEDLASIYSNAYSFFYMSLYEGFGLPPLEAMQCGTPTVTSNTSSLPEVIGNAGITLDPKDENALCDVMWTLYSNQNLRENLSFKGLQRSKLFSWQKCAEEHVNIYKKILDHI